MSKVSFAPPVNSNKLGIDRLSMPGFAREDQSSEPNRTVKVYLQTFQEVAALLETLSTDDDLPSLSRQQVLHLKELYLKISPYTQDLLEVIAAEQSKGYISKKQQSFVQKKTAANTVFVLLVNSQSPQSALFHSALEAMVKIHSALEHISRKSEGGELQPRGLYGEAERATEEFVTSLKALQARLLEEGARHELRQGLLSSRLSPWRSAQQVSTATLFSSAKESSVVGGADLSRVSLTMIRSVTLQQLAHLSSEGGDQKVIHELRSRLEKVTPSAIAELENSARYDRSSKPSSRTLDYWALRHEIVAASNYATSAREVRHLKGQLDEVSKALGVEDYSSIRASTTMNFWLEKSRFFLSQAQDFAALGKAPTLEAMQLLSTQHQKRFAEKFSEERIERLVEHMRIEARTAFANRAALSASLDTVRFVGPLALGATGVGVIPAAVMNGGVNFVAENFQASQKRFAAEAGFENRQTASDEYKAIEQNALRSSLAVTGSSLAFAGFSSFANVVGNPVVRPLVGLGLSRNYARGIGAATWGATVAGGGSLVSRLTFDQIVSSPSALNGEVATRQVMLSMALGGVASRSRHVAYGLGGFFAASDVLSSDKISIESVMQTMNYIDSVSAGSRSGKAPMARHGSFPSFFGGGEGLFKNHVELQPALSAAHSGAGPKNVSSVPHESQMSSKGRGSGHGEDGSSLEGSSGGGGAEKSKKKRKTRRASELYCSTCQRETPHALEVGAGRGFSEKRVCEICKPAEEDPAELDRQQKAYFRSLRHRRW